MTIGFLTMVKYNNIAVFIRGHKRMWDYIKKNLFESYDHISENVDYYVALWETAELNLDKIKSDFVGKTLIACITPPLFESFSGSWKSQGWLPYNLLPYKKIREESVTYDAVFDQRTDSIITDYYVCEKFVLEPMILYSQWPVSSTDEMTRHDGTGITTVHPFPLKTIKDFGFMCDSKTFDILTYRFAFFEHQDVPVEHLLYNYCKKNKISIEKKHPFRSCIVRPTLCSNPNITHPIGSIINKETFIGDRMVTLSPFWDDFAKWHNLSPTEKIELCQQYNIDFEDYMDKI
jgi:hypothetical protein